jgi:hypothetical protein
MDCINCNANIPPAWVSCINNNICPGCGKAIMDEKSKELLDELSSAMKKMPNDPEGLAGWLLSNYRLEKIGSAEPIEFHRQRQNGNNIPEGDMKMGNSKVQQFFKNAGVDIDRKKKLRDVMSDLDTGNTSVEMDVGGEFVPHTPESLMKDELANNSLVLPGDGEPHLSSEETAIMMKLVSKAKAQKPGLQALNEERMERLAKQRELEAGGSIGKISRGG